MLGQLLFWGSLPLAGTARWHFGLGVVSWLEQLLLRGSLLLAGTACWLLGLGVLFLGGSLVLAVASWCLLDNVVSVEAHPLDGSSAPTAIRVSWHRRGPFARE